MKKILQRLMAGEPASPDDVTQVMDKLMAGELDPIYAGAFLCLQMRNEIDGDQLKAALEVMLRYATTISVKDPEAIDNCGTGGDGGSGFNVSTTSAFVVAGAGHTMAKHGNRAVSSTCGSADLLEDVGVNLNLAPAQIQECIDEVGIGFMFAPVFHPSVRHAVPVRKGLRVRTMFNMLGPLANPAGAKCQLIGVFQEDLTELFGDVLAKMGKRAYVVFGENGSDEVSLTTRTKVTEVKDGTFNSYIFDPRQHGFDLCREEDLGGGNLEKNRQIFEEVLRDGKEGPCLDMVVLNAGFAMHTSSRYADIDEAFDAAREAVSSGKAWAKVQELIAWSKKHS
ncbi:MAG: anthranilate phosphoribosyltransferase [Acidobacteriota bacterium]|nr:anthranilate phosphoribosyltransferase [Acidobacteriota bacterium]